MSVNFDIHRQTPPPPLTRETTPSTAPNSTSQKEKELQLPKLSNTTIGMIVAALKKPRALYDPYGYKLGEVSIHQVLTYLSTPQHPYDHAIPMKSVKIIGSSVPYLLGVDYLKKAMKIAEIPLSQTRELPTPSDIDIRIQVDEAHIFHCYPRLKNYLLTLFGKEPNYGDRALAPSYGYYKYRKVKEEIDSQCKKENRKIDKFALITLGDVDFIFYSELVRESYFSTDDLAIDVTKLLLFPQYSLLPILESRIASPWQALKDLALGTIHAHDIETLDQMSWATLMRHITRGRICPDVIQDQLFEKVSPYKEDTVERIIGQLEKSLKKHLNRDPRARVALTFNACIALEGKKLYRPKIEGIWKALLKGIGELKSPLLNFLSQSNLSFTTLSSAVKIAACCSEDRKIATRLIDKHNGGRAIQLKENFFLTFPPPNANTLLRMLNSGELDERLLPLFHLFQKETASWVELFLNSKNPSARESASALVRQGLPCSLEEKAILFASSPMNTPGELAQLVPLAKIFIQQRQPKLGPNAKKCAERIFGMLSQVPAEQALEILHQAWDNRWVCNEGKRVASIFLALCEQADNPLQALSFWEEGKDSWKKHISEQQIAAMLSKHLFQIDFKDVKGRESILKDLKDTRSMTFRELLFSAFKDKIHGSAESQKQALIFLKRLLKGQNMSETRLQEALFLALDELLKGDEWAIAQGVDLLIESYRQRPLMLNDQRFSRLIQKYLRAIFYQHPTLKSKGTILLEMLLKKEKEVSPAIARCVVNYLKHELTPADSLKGSVRDRQEEIFRHLTPNEAAILLSSFDIHKIPLKPSVELFSKVFEGTISANTLTLIVKTIDKEKWQGPNSLIEKIQDRLSTLPLDHYKSLLTLLNTHSAESIKTRGLLQLAGRMEKEGKPTSAAIIYLKLPATTIIPSDITGLIQTLTQSDTTFRLGLSLLTRFRNRTDVWLTVAQGLKGRNLAIKKTACKAWKAGCQRFKETPEYAECWLSFLELNFPGLTPHTRFCELENLFINHLPKSKLVDARSALYLQTADHLLTLPPGMAPHIESNLPKLSSDAQKMVQSKLIRFYLKSENKEVFLRGIMHLQNSQEKRVLFTALKRLAKDAPCDTPLQILGELQKISLPKLDEKEQTKALGYLTQFMQQFVFLISLEKSIALLDSIPWLSMNAIKRNGIRVALIKHSFTTIDKTSPASAIESVFKLYFEIIKQLPPSDIDRLIKSAVPPLIFAMGNKNFYDKFAVTIADFLRSLGVPEIKNGVETSSFEIERNTLLEFLTNFFSCLFNTYPSENIHHDHIGRKLYEYMEALLHLDGCKSKGICELFFQFVFHFWSEDRAKFNDHGIKCRDLLEKFHAPLIGAWKPLKFLQVSLFLEYQCSDSEVVQQIMDLTPYQEAIEEVLERITQKDSPLMRRHALSILQGMQSMILYDVRLTQSCFQMLIRSCAKAPFEVMENIPGPMGKLPIIELILILFCEGPLRTLISLKGGEKASFEIAKTFIETFKTYSTTYAKKEDYSNAVKYMAYLLGKLAGYGIFNSYSLHYFMMVNELQELAISLCTSNTELQKWSETLFDLLFHKSLTNGVTLKPHSSKVSKRRDAARDKVVQNWMRLVSKTDIKGAKGIAQEELEKCKTRIAKENR